MDVIDFFKSTNSVTHKQYEALRMYYMEGVSAQQVAGHFGYTYRAFTSLVTSFRRKVIMNPKDSIFFVENAPGRKISTRLPAPDLLSLICEKSIILYRK